MKARTKIEKQVAASNEKLTVLSPKVLTWAVRKVAGHVCFRTSAHKCTCGDCGRHFDYEGKGKSVCCPYCGTRLQIKDTLKRTIKEAYYFSSLEVIDHLQVQRVFRLETTFRKGMPMEILSAHDKEGNRIETIEFSLTEGKVIQSRGLCNTNTPHHDRIVRLVNAHAHQILAAKQTA